MRKFYLYAAILISLFAAGFALAEKTGFAGLSDFPEPETEAVSEASDSEENSLASLACDFTVTVAMKKAHSSCKNIDGWLKASVSGGSGSYTYDWYTDTDVFVGTGADLKEKEAGVYYVEVTDTNTGNVCRKTGIIEDDTPNMGYDAQILKNVIGCDGIGGGKLSLKMLESDANNNLPHWYDENGVLIGKDGNANMVDGAWIFDNLPAGTYTIIVKNANTGCEGEPFTIEIGQMTPPTITGTTVDNTLCVGGDGELNLTITTDGPAPVNGFELSWTGPDAASSGSTSGVISTYNITDLPSGTYTVTASDPDDDACTTTETFVINDARVYPTLELDTTPNTVCIENATNGGFDGTISITKVTEDGQEYTDFSNYEFNWMDGDGNLLGTTSAGLYTQLEHGSYLVSVTNITTGCPSGEYPVEVPLSSPTLSLVLEAEPQTYCSGTPNGSITATASTSEPDGYTLEWYQGNDETGSLMSVTGLTATELNGDQNYFVKLTDNYTGCSTSQSIYVTKALVTPEISGIPTDNTICDPALTSPAVSYNGTINVTVDNATTGDTYTYSWTGDNGTNGTLSGSNTLTINSLPAGQYSIVATNATTGCPSGELAIEVRQNTVDPALSIVTADNTACDPLLNNGTATVSVTNATDTYTYEWTQNGSAIGQNTAQASGLGAGTYAVLVTNNATGCQASIAGTIQTVTTDPVASIGVQTAITCLLDGVMEASVVGPDANTNYTIIWYRGEGADEANKITEVAGTTSTLSTYNGGVLPSDYYTVVVRNDDSGCTSEAVTEYLAPPADPFVVDLITNRSPNLCDEASGVITAWVNDGTGSGNREITNYTFEWYEGRPTDPNASFYSDPPIQFAGSALTVDADQIATSIDLSPEGFTLGTHYYEEMGATNGQTLYKAKPGIYTVVVTNADGCKALKEVKLDYPNAPEANFVIDDIDECNGTGAISVQLTDNATPPNILDQTQYQFKLFKGQNQTGTPTIVDPPTANHVSEFNGLPPGWYTVVAFDLQGCQTYAETVELKQLSLEPVVSISNKSPNESCGTPDGSFDITVGPKTGDNQTVAYFITIIDPNGASVSLPNNGVYSPGTHTIPNLAEGDYTIIVEGIKSDGTTHTDCDTEVNTTLGRNTPLPVLTASATDQTVCSPPNGSARVTQISFDGTTFGSNPPAASDFADFTFAWYGSEQDYTNEVKLEDINGQLITGFEATGLAPGTYYVTASKTTGLSSGCPSAPAIVTVSDVSTLPIISFDSQAQGDCGSPNGTLSATVTTAGANANNYTFNWYVGEGTGTPFVDGTDGNINTLSTNQQRLENLVAGKYTLEIIEGNCTPVVKTYEVGSTISQPVISGFGTPAPNNVCNYDEVNTFPNGSFTVNEVTYNGTTFSGTAIDLNFDFTLYPEDPATGATGIDKDALITGLEPGTYYLVATKITNPGIGCGQTPFVFTIEDQPLRPVFSILNGTASNSCPGGVPNGSLTASISRSDGQPLTAADYSIDWTYTDADGISSPVAAGSISTDQLQLSGLAAGTYKAVATLTDYGCPVTATYTIGQENFDFTLTTNQVDQVGCINGGSISIPADGITINGNPAALSEFTFNWYRKDANGTETLITGLAPNTTNLNVTNYPAIEAGTYVVEAVKNTNPAAGCGPRVTAIIPYVDAMPAIAVNLVRPVSGCNPDSKGLIDITVSSPLGNPLEVRWFTNTQYDESGATDQPYLGPVIYNSGEQVLLEGLESGYYRVEVKDTDPAIQCTTSYIFFIDEQSATAILSASAQDAWKCSPPNGEIFVLMDNKEAYSQLYPDSRFDITIDRQEDDFTETKLLDISFTDTLTFKGLGIGTYIVSYLEQPVNGILLSGCEILSDTVQILDSSTPVLAEIEQTAAYNVCDPALANGALSAYALVNGTQTTEGYSFAWYEGAVDESTTEQPFHNAATVSDLKDTTYTVIVTRDLTGCTAVAQHTITDEAIPFTPAIEQDVLLTKCDPALANAELVASVGDSTTGYTFEWFLGDADLSTPAGEALFTQARATGLRDTTYTVRVTNPLTGCQGLASHTIEVDYPVVPVDSSWIVSAPSTSCQYPTGSLEVGVDSLYTNYSFSWYKGAEAHPDSLLAADVYKLDSLAPGIYTITITSAENGCTSTAFTKEVGEDYYFPKYQITIKPSTCIEEGTASIIDVEGKIPFYEWYYEDKGEPIATNGPFSGPAGNYWLKIVSDLGCVKWVPVEINSVVDPYNAVSINGDGENDYFHIDCIEMFPENRVRIYNRAGTLVFEATGYDNSLNSFTGFGNRGLYFNGKELPVGTYYYYVDKRHKDEKPQTGFLELLR